MSLAWGIFGGILGLVWLWRGAEVAFGMRRVAEITARLTDITARQSRCVAACVTDLASSGVRMLTWADLTGASP